MRFAGSAPITDFLNKSVDMGSVAQKAAENRSALKNAGTQLEGEIGAAGIRAQGEVEAAGILGAAQSSLVISAELRPELCRYPRCSTIKPCVSTRQRFDDEEYWWNCQ